MSPWNGRSRVVVVGEEREGWESYGQNVLQFLGNKSPTGMVGIWT